MNTASMSVTRSSYSFAGLFTGVMKLTAAFYAAAFGYVPNAETLVAIGLIMGLIGFATFLVQAVVMYFRQPNLLETSVKEFLNGYCLGGFLGGVFVVMLILLL